MGRQGCQPTQYSMGFLGVAALLCVPLTTSGLVHTVGSWGSCTGVVCRRRWNGEGRARSNIAVALSPSTPSRGTSSSDDDWDVVSALENLRFDNSALRELKADPVHGGPVRRVRGAHLARVDPSPLKSPTLAALSPEAMALIGLPAKTIADIDGAQQRALAEIFSGNRILRGSEPFAACYCGHQFGIFAGQLGDGAVMSIGEVVNDQGQRWELQLKGAGLTPFSRMADGRKVLRSSVREYLCSEAMHHLGIPTTRALALVVSDSRVTRDLTSVGQLRDEKCAVLVRVAEGFLRFGSFEVCLVSDSATAPSAGLEKQVLAPLLSYAIGRHMPSAGMARDGATGAEFLKRVAQKTAALVAAWQAVGFVHGVLNTDNMAITGETIDYGPFGFMDVYDPDYVPNSSDAAGRYSYAAQPGVCAWNIERLGESLQNLLPPGSTEQALAAYWKTFNSEYRARFRRKLGLLIVEEEGDEQLLQSLFEVMQRTGADFTNCFRALSREPFPLSERDCYTPPQSFDAVFEYMLSQCASVEVLQKLLRPALHPNALARLRAIAANDPEQLAGFGLDRAVLERESRRAARREELANMAPRDKRRADAEAWRDWLYKYRLRILREKQAVEKRARKSAAGGSAGEVASAVQAAAIRRVMVMEANNPRFVLRQYAAARAIERAAANDFAEIEKVLGVLRRPFEEQGFLVTEKYASFPPDWSHELTLT